jgi:hypothetical protein
MGSPATIGTAAAIAHARARRRIDRTEGDDMVTARYCLRGAKEEFASIQP